MIIDKLQNASQYFAINSRFQKAFEFLADKNLKELPIGKYKIDSENIFAMISHDQGRKKEDASLEIHQDYIDIQVVLEGIDNMGWRPAVLCNQPKTDYDSDSDIQFFFDEPMVYLPVMKDMFVIFSPEDAHKPAISTGKIHKVVVKIAI